MSSPLSVRGASSRLGRLLLPLVALTVSMLAGLLLVLLGGGGAGEGGAPAALRPSAGARGGAPEPGGAPEAEALLAAGRPVTERVAAPLPVGPRGPAAAERESFDLVLRGRPVDARGAALAIRHISAQVVEGAAGAPRQYPLHTDPEGRLVFEHSRDRQAPLAIRFWSQVRGVELQARLEVPAATTGLLELGDIVFHEPPIFLAGHVVDAEGAPIRGASVHLHFLPGRGAAEGTDGQVISSASSGRQGEFQLPADPREGTLVVRVSAPGFLEARLPVEHESYSERIVLQRERALAGRLLLDSSVSAPRLRVRGTASEPHLPDVHAYLRSDGNFSIPGIQPGTYTFDLGGAGWIGPPLVLWRDVLVTGEPAYLHLDLSASVASTELFAVDPAGEPIEGLMASFAPRDAEPGTSRQWVRGGQRFKSSDDVPPLRLLHAAGSWKVLARAAGYQSASIWISGGRVQATLAPGPRPAGARVR